MAKIWNITPLGNQYYPRGLDAVTANLMQELAWNTVQNFSGNWYYDATLVPDHQNPSPRIEAWNSLVSKAFEPDQILLTAI